MAGGLVGGRVLQVPPGVRPSTSLLRAAAFDMLAPDPQGWRVADLYAGSGALGIEALSRGAVHAIFVDSASASVAIIESNLARLALQSSAQVIRAEAAQTVRRGVLGSAQLVLLDPPYEIAELELAELMAALDEDLGEGTELVWEHSHRRPPPEPRRLKLWRRRRYGDSALSMYRQTVG